MSEKKQVIRNLLVNVASLTSRLLIGLWLTPYLVSHMGTAAYGFVPIAAILTEYISIVTSSINQAISRYLVLSIQEGDWRGANKTFNTAFFSNLSLFIAQIPLFGIVLFNLSEIFTIPPELKQDVSYLFLLSMLSFSTSVFSAVFSTSMFAHNRLDLMRLTDIVGFALRVGIIVVMFTVDEPKLYYVGFGELAAALFLLLASTHFWRKLTPRLSIRISQFDKDRLRNILSMSGWLMVNYVGYLLFIKIDVIIVNRFIGASEAGQYAAILQWSNVIRTIVSVLAIVTTPLVLAAYAKKDYERIRFLLVTSMNMIGVAISIIIAILMVQSESLLTVWIGSDIAQLYPLLIVLISHLSVNLSVIPLFSIFPAYEKVKLPGIVTMLSGVANFALAILLVVATDFGIYGVALAGLLVLTLKNAIFTPLYASHIMKLPYHVYLVPIGRTVLSTAMVTAFALVLRLFSIDSWGDLIVSSAAVSIGVLPFVWKVSLSKKDRRFALSLLPEKIGSKLKWTE